MFDVTQKKDAEIDKILEQNRSDNPKKDNIFEESIYNLEILEDAGFGEKNDWKKLKKKLGREESLEEYEHEFFQEKALDYKQAQKKKREWRLDKIEKLEREGFGEKNRWDSLKNTLNEEKNLDDQDLQYFLVKSKESKRGIISTTNYIEDRKVISYLGIVSGQAAMGMNFISDWITKWSDVFGGRSGTFEKYFQRGREDALNDMGEEAKSLGANGIIGVSVNFTPIGAKDKNMLMIVATGTAVITEGKNRDSPDNEKI